MVLGSRGRWWGSAFAGLTEGAIALERGDADGQNVGAGEEQRVPKAWTCLLGQVCSTLQHGGGKSELI